MTEAELQANVLELCKAMGLLAYHTHDSRRSQPGFPDLVIVGKNAVLYRELKSEKGKVRPDQLYWLTALLHCHQDADIWRPEHWPEVITRELSALGSVVAAPPQLSQAELRKKIGSRARK